METVYRSQAVFGNGGDPPQDPPETIRTAVLQIGGARGADSEAAVWFLARASDLCERSAMDGPTELVVCEGDETGQELLEQALRVFGSPVLTVPIALHRFDLSLAHRRQTENRVVQEAAEAMVATGLGLKAATITPPGIGDVGSPNRILREGIGGSVIVRTGRRIPGVVPPAPVVHPIVVVRMAVGDAYGAEEGRTGTPGGPDEGAWRLEKIERSTCRAVAEYSFRTAATLGANVYGGPKWTVSPVYEGLLKEEMDAAAERHPGVRYRPVLIDAAYAGLLTESGDQPLVIPALNRDGDALSDLVLALFGSIAGAESVLLALDDALRPTVAMAEAPHGTAPSLMGKDVANPMAMLLACAAVLDYAAARGDSELAVAAGAIRAATLGAAADGIRTFDLGGDASTTEFVDEVLVRLTTGP
jgi:isocitrate/isopropylmalate dehydrogenase